MLTRSLIPWPKLVRHGIPEMEVCRRPLPVGGVVLNPGTTLPVGLLVHKVRMRQLYESRLIQPVDAPMGSVQAANESVRRRLTLADRQSPQPGTEVVPTIVNFDGRVATSVSVSVPVSYVPVSTSIPVSMPVPVAEVVSYNPRKRQLKSSSKGDQ